LDEFENLDRTLGAHGWDPRGEAGEWDLPTVAVMMGIRGEGEEPDHPVIRGSRSLRLPSDDDKPNQVAGALSRSDVDAKLAANLAAREAAGERRAAEGDT
jgi:hypothetical protein